MGTKFYKAKVLASFGNYTFQHIFYADEIILVHGDLVVDSSLLPNCVSINGIKNVKPCYFNSQIIQIIKIFDDKGLWRLL
jgi:hypothetical protein